jgi:glycosyltransferase involved in cell wall biosynthesis
VRLAVWAPLPPQPSGVADYVSTLLVELARAVDVVAVVRDAARNSAVAPAGVEVVARSDYDARGVDLDIYHFGNHARFHGYMYSQIRRRPGILVLHDPALPGFHHDLCGGYASTLFCDEARFDTPEVTSAWPVRYVDDRVETDWLRLPLCRRLVEASQATIVHSRWVADTLTAHCPGARIVHRHHAATVVEDGAGRDEKGVVTFGAFGGITPPKRTARVVEAFAAVHREAPRTRLVICGRADVGETELAGVGQVVAGLGLAGSVLVRTDVPAAELTQLMASCDATISLRWPTLGETSGPMMRAFGIGRIVITSAVPQVREFDGRYCRLVPVGDGEHAGVVGAMRDVVADPVAARAAGEAARDFVRREASFEVVASQYLELADEVIATQVRSPGPALGRG